MKTLIRFARGYLIAFVVTAALLTLFGSFIAGELWSPFATTGRRLTLAWLGCYGLIPPLVKGLPE